MKLFTKLPPEENFFDLQANLNACRLNIARVRQTYSLLAQIPYRSELEDKAMRGYWEILTGYEGCEAKIMLHLRKFLN